MQVRFLRSCRTGYVTAILKEYGFEGASTLFHASGGFHHELELTASKVSTELRERCKWDRKGCHTGCILAKVQPALMEKQPVSHAKTLINLKIPEKKKVIFGHFHQFFGCCGGEFFFASPTPLRSLTSPLL